MFKNVASQKLTFFAFDYSTGAPKTGDAANITIYLSKDDGSVTILTDTSASEVDSTNAKGDYSVDLSQAETNADKLRFTGKSSTSNVVIVPQTIYTVPSNFTSTTLDDLPTGSELGVALSAMAATMSGDIARIVQNYTNVYYVLSTGNDSNSGLYPAAAKLTLASAKAAALSGDLIVVGPGTYNERNLFKTGVDWYFARGAVVNYTGSAAGGMFDDSSNGANGAVVCRVFGYGRFIHATSNTAIRPVLYLSNASSRVQFECLDLINQCSTSTGVPAAIYHGSGRLDVVSHGTISSDQTHAIEGEGTPGSSLQVNGQLIQSPVAGVKNFAASPSTIIADRIIGGTTGGVHIDLQDVIVPTQVTIIANHVSGYIGVYNRGSDRTLHSVVLRIGHCVGTGLNAVEGDSNVSVFIDGGLYESIYSGSGGNGLESYDDGFVYAQNATFRSGTLGKDISVVGTAQVSVSNCDYRRTNTSGTIIEAPPADYVTSIKTDTTTLLSRITSSLFTGITSLAQWLGLLAGKQTGNSTARTEIRATGAGSGTYDETTDSQEAIRDNGGGGGGGDCPTVEEIDAYLAAQHGAGAWDGGGTGSGARSVTITVNDGSTVLESARVRFTKGAESYLGVTNASGVVMFALDDGTWTVTITLAGYSFTPTTKVVDGTETQTYSMTLVAVTPSDPGLITATSIVKSAGVGLADTVITYNVTSVSPEVTGLIIVGATEQEATSTTGGAIQFTNVQPGATYSWTSSTNSEGEFSIPIDAEDGYALPAFVV